MSEFVCLNNWPQFTLLTLRLIWTVGQWHDILEGTIRLKKSFPQSWPRQKWSAYRDLLIVVGHFSPPAFFQSCDATSSDGIFHSFCPDANYFLRYAKPSSYSFKIKPSFIWRFSSLNKGRGNLLICVIGSRNLVDTWLLLPIMPVLLGTGTSSKGFCRTYVLRNRLLDSLFFMLFFGNMSDWLCGSDCREWWLISHEPLNSTHLETTLIATDLKLSQWLRTKCSGSPSHPRTLAFLSSLCNVKLCTGVSTFTNNNLCTPNISENRPAESVNVCV